MVVTEKNTISNGTNTQNKFTTQCHCPILKYTNEKRKSTRTFVNTSTIAFTYKWNLYLACILLFISETYCLTNEDREFCSNLNLTKAHQEEFCRHHTDVVRALYDGYMIGYEQCKYSFKDSSLTGTRWNCTNAPDDRNVFLGIAHARVGSRENAVMSSFTAAGMLHTLVTQCKKGLIKTCQPSVLYTCPFNGHDVKADDRLSCTKINWDIPMTLINRFFTVTQYSLKYDVENHNRNIGFKVVKTLVKMSKKCNRKGKCLDQEQLRPLKDLNDGFISQYKASVKIKKRNVTGQKIPTKKKIKFNNRLFHFRGRFSYCSYNPIWKWDGIGRRECYEVTEDSFSINNCIVMCCGFGYIKVSETKKECSMKLKPTYKVTCTKKTYDRFYCKYYNEADRRPTADFRWQDPPQWKIKGSTVDPEDEHDM